MTPVKYLPLSRMPIKKMPVKVMAQSGCFVPAINEPQPMFRVADSIFSRVGMSDSIECNASTFAMEMKEMAYILNNLGDSSLVIIDELGKDYSICSEWKKGCMRPFNLNNYFRLHACVSLHA